MITLRFQYSPADSLELTFDNTATVRTAKEFLAKRVLTVADNITLTVNRKILGDSSMLTKLGVPNGATVTATISTSRPFRFIERGRQPFVLPFRETARVIDAKRAIAPKLKESPDRISLKFDEKPLVDDQRLLDLRISRNRFITIDVEPEESPKLKYLFMLQGEGRELSFDEEASVGDAIRALMEMSEKGTKSVSLFYDGRPLKDKSVRLADIGVPKGEFIVAQSEVMPIAELRHLNAPAILIPGDEGDSESENSDVLPGGIKKQSSKLLSQLFEIVPPERQEDPPADPMNVPLTDGLVTSATEEEVSHDRSLPADFAFDESDGDDQVPMEDETKQELTPVDKNLDNEAQTKEATAADESAEETPEQRSTASEEQSAGDAKME